MGNFLVSPPRQTLYTDLSGVFQVQQQYYKNLVGNINDPSMNENINSLQNQLDNLNTGFKQANVSTNQVLTQQKDMIDIVDTEKKRLELKKQSIDGALVSRDRAVIMNDSYRQRYVLYTKMMVIFVFGLAIFIAAVLLGQYFPIIPPFVITLVCAIDIIIVLFSCYFIYLEVIQRNPLNFNELNLDGPTVLSPDQIKATQANAQKSGDLLGSLNLGQCVGVACCSDGTVWDASNSYCVPNSTKSIADAAASVISSDAIRTAGSAIGTTSSATSNTLGFTTILDSYKLGDFSNKISVNSPNEFERYSRT